MDMFIIFFKLLILLLDLTASSRVDQVLTDD